MKNIRNLKDVISYIELMLKREGHGDDPIDIASDITDLMGLDVVYELKKEYPKLEDLLEAAADLEVSRSVIYEPPEELWGKVKDLTVQLRNEIMDDDTP